MPKPDQRQGASSAERIGSVVIGILFVAIALWLGVMTWPQPSRGEVLVVLVVGSLGIDAILSALQRRRSFLSRIGPLP